MTFREAVTTYGVKLTATRIGARPDGLVDIPEGTYWRLKLTRTWWEPVGPAKVSCKFRKAWTVYWSQGSAYTEGPSDPAEVLESLNLDRVFEDFDNWARGCGYDTDSRKAEKIYKACVKATKQWERFWEGTPLASAEWYPTEAV